MFGISDLIIGMWFLPVTLCIIIPLAILFGWSITRLGKPTANYGNVNEIEEQAIETDDFTKYKN